MPGSFTNLLSQTTQAPASDAPITLADTLRLHARDLTDKDITTLVAGLREQRVRWSANQASGNKERVTAKKIKAKQPQVQLNGFTLKKPTL